mgnify:CR=1 FL=1
MGYKIRFSFNSQDIFAWQYFCLPLLALVLVSASSMMDCIISGNRKWMSIILLSSSGIRHIEMRFQVWISVSFLISISLWWLRKKLSRFWRMPKLWKEIQIRQMSLKSSWNMLRLWSGISQNFWRSWHIPMIPLAKLRSPIFWTSLMRLGIYQNMTPTVLAWIGLIQREIYKNQIWHLKKSTKNQSQFLLWLNKKLAEIKS